MSFCSRSLRLSVVFPCPGNASPNWNLAPVGGDEGRLVSSLMERPSRIAPVTESGVKTLEDDSGVASLMLRLSTVSDCEAALDPEVVMPGEF